MSVISFKKHRGQNLSIRYRAVCITCNYRGKWKATMPESEADAAAHKTTNPKHKLDVEIEQKLSMFAKIN